MTERTTAGTARRPYQPPQLEEVQLVAEEAVLKQCKTTLEAGAEMGFCKPDQGPGCQGVGS